MQLFGITWLGLTPENARKLAVSVVLVAVVLLTSAVLRALLGRLAQRAEQPSLHVGFWTRQVIALAAAAAIVIGLLIE